jgi:hypothetical protein
VLYNSLEPTKNYRLLSMLIPIFEFLLMWLNNLFYVLFYICLCFIGF